MTEQKFDYDSEMRDIRMNFAKTRENGYAFIPTVWLYKGGEKVVKIIARHTRDASTQEQALVFKEMFAAIAFVDADQILFSADAYFNMFNAMENMSEDEKQSMMRKRANNLEKDGVNAQYSIVCQKYGPPSVSIDPYIQDNTDKIWRLNIPDFPIHDQHGHGALVDHDKVLSWMQRMYAVLFVETDLPLDASVYFDTMESIGHHVSVKNTFHVD